MSTRKINILFVIPNLSPGGAERIMSYLASKMNPNSFTTRMIVLCKQEGNSIDTDGLDVTFLGHSRVLNAVPDLLKIIYRKKPAIVFGTLSHINLILGFISILFPKTTFIGRQTSIAAVYDELSNTKGINLFSRLLKIAFRKLDFVICQSNDMAQDCVALFGLQEKRLVIIQNPITDNFELHGSRVKNIAQERYNFITVGRFVTVKGHERILRILAQFKKPYTYTLVGDGELRESLFALADKLGITENIKHIPFTKNVAEFLNKSDYFLQGSLSEGFPNALLESCAVGTPVIAFDVPGGTKEIVQHGVNGFLVANESEFLNILNNLVPLEPAVVSESVYSKFDKKIILAKYESLFKASLKS